MICHCCLLTRKGCTELHGWMSTCSRRTERRAYGSWLVGSHALSREPEAHPCSHELRNKMHSVLRSLHRPAQYSSFSLAASPNGPLHPKTEGQRNMLARQIVAEVETRCTIRDAASATPGSLFLSVSSDVSFPHVAVCETCSAALARGSIRKGDDSPFQRAGQRPKTGTPRLQGGNTIWNTWTSATRVRLSTSRRGFLQLRLRMPGKPGLTCL